MSEEFVDVKTAFLEAVAEMEAEESVDAEPALPAVEAEPTVPTEQAVEAPVEQTEEVADADQPIEVDAEMQDLLDDIVEEEAGDAEAQEAEVDPVDAFLNSDDFFSTNVEIETADGVVTVNISELTDGYLRQGDYTRKTQGLATERERLTEASEFMSKFQEDPVAFAQALAVKAGLVEEGSVPVVDIDEVAKMLTPEQFEAEIQARVDARFQEDPRSADLAIADARAKANALFASIEATHSVTLDDDVRQSIIDEAARRNTGDFELVFEAKLNRVKSKRSQGQNLRDAAPSRPTRPAAPGSDADSEPVIETAEDAFLAAEAELNA